MSAILSILAVSALFALSAFVARRGCGGECGSCHASCWFKEKDHGSHRS